jgi:fibrillarin-like rRNA methylase
MAGDAMHKILSFAPIPSGFADMFKEDEKKQAAAPEASTRSSSYDAATIEANEAERQRRAARSKAASTLLVGSEVDSSASSKTLLGR